MIEKISNGIIPVLADRIIMQSEISSCKTDSRNIISRSLTIAPFNTIISSPLMTPEIERCEFDTIILLTCSIAFTIVYCDICQGHLPLFMAILLSSTRLT